MTPHGELGPIAASSQRDRLRKQADVRSCWCGSALGGVAHRHAYAVDGQLDDVLRPREAREGCATYAEHMFKADGEIVLQRLQNHIRRRGYGKWVSVATSEKGSYRTEDVLNFLETHLPPQSRLEEPGAEWRIMMADDHRPHLSPHVARLCWKRGYVFIPHMGGWRQWSRRWTPTLTKPSRRATRH